jgi:phosphate starvation-inducible protein PhoH and related proteins
MSRKKTKTVNKNLLANSHIEEEIQDNQLPTIRKLKIKKNKKFNEKQSIFFDIATKDSTKLMFIDGPAGTAKTWLSVYCGLELFQNQKIEEMIYVRSAVESSDQKLGFLPGAQDDKMAPYLEPFKDKLEELLDPIDIRYLQDEERIYGIPVGFLRGASWENKFILVDEAQNLSEKELVTIMTRIGENCKVFICGDAMQSDIGNRSGFNSILDLFKDDASKDKGIQTFQFTENDIVRSELVKFIITKLKSLVK